MADRLFGTGAFIGNPNIQRQGAKARELAQRRDVNTLPDPKTYAAVTGLFGTAPDQMGFSVLHPQYQQIQQVALPAFVAGTALGVAPLFGAAVRGARQIPGMIQEMRPTPLPLQWYHGTSPEAAAQIRQSGRFDPTAGKRQYDYSELGPNTVYFAPEGSWWLDPKKAAEGRAASYSDRVAMQLAKNANVKVIDSPAQFDKIARSVGYKDGADLRNALWVDNLQSRQYAADVSQGTFSDFVKRRIDEINKFGYDIKTVQEAAALDQQSVKDWVANSQRLYQMYKTFENQYEQANAATNALLKQGIDGLYFSPKFAKRSFDQGYAGEVASDQLGIFRPGVAKVADNPTYKDPFADTTR